MRKSIIDIINELNNLNIKLIDCNAYKNNKTKMILMDNEGYLYSMSYNQITKITLSRKFTKSNPFTIQNIKNYLKINDINLELVSTSYEGNFKEYKFTWRCSCGNEYNATFGDVRYSNQVKCKVCSKKVKQDIEVIRKYIEDNNISTKLISNEYKNYQDKLLWECECGETFECSLQHFKVSKQHRCSNCTKSKSNMESLVEKYLTDNKFNFIREKSIKGCKSIKSLPFDFIVHINGEDICIECDGEQHFKPRQFGGIDKHKAYLSWADTIYRDCIKNSFCEDNNIKLIRLPYWYFKDDTYIKILNEKLTK